MTDFYKTPRLYIDEPLCAGEAVALPAGSLHYLKNVLRQNPGDPVRLFNGRDGEFSASLEYPDKKRGAARLIGLLRPQAPAPRPLHLYFPPLKKERLDFLIEKSVELGVTGLHPILSARTEQRKINEERLRAQIIEAAEQCERLDIPVLHVLQPLEKILSGPAADPAFLLYAALERREAAPLADCAPDRNGAGLLIGPPGGWTDEEKDRLARTKTVRPVTLGERILRTETAALAGLTLLSR